MNFKDIIHYQFSIFLYIDELKDVYNSVFPKIKCAKAAGTDGPEALRVCAVNAGS